MRREGCDRSASVNSNRHSYTSYHYTQLLYSYLGNYHLLCINKDVSDLGCICDVRHSGTLPWTCLVAVWGSSGLHRWKTAKSLCQHKAWSSLWQDNSLPGKKQHRRSSSSSSSCVVCQDRWAGGQVISWVPEAFVTPQILLHQGCQETQNLTREDASASSFCIDQLNWFLACSLFCLFIGVPIHTWGFLLGHLPLLQDL